MRGHDSSAILGADPMPEAAGVVVFSLIRVAATGAGLVTAVVVFWRGTSGNSPGDYLCINTNCWLLFGDFADSRVVSACAIDLTLAAALGVAKPLAVVALRPAGSFPG